MDGTGGRAGRDGCPGPHRHSPARRRQPASRDGMTGQQQRMPAVPGPSPASLHARAGDVVVLPRRGLQISRQLSFERWLSVGRQLSDVYTSSVWCLGDWLAYGEAAYSGRYRSAIEQTSLDYQTLRNYAWVAKRFSLSRRRDSLSFGHHAEVAALAEAEQDFWLRKADELGWPVKRLRREVRMSLAERASGNGGWPDGAMPGDQPDARDRDYRPMVSVQIRVTREQLEGCRIAASRVGLTVEAWAALALDRAARDSDGCPGDGGAPFR
jgi:hypothetical protein